MLMKISRRKFIAALSTILVTFGSVNEAAARIRGSVASAGTTNDNRVSINVPSTGWMNIAKTAIFTLPAGTVVNNDGFPTSALSSSCSLELLSDFYDQYVWKWTNTMAMQFISLPAIVYAGGGTSTPSINQGGGPAGTGWVAGNFTVGAASANPRVVFNFGTLVTAVSGGSGSLVTITHAATSSGFSTGTKFKFKVGCSANLTNGNNSDGSWTITNVSPTSFTLNGSTGVVSPTVTGSGGVGTQTEAIKNQPNCSFTYLNSGTWSNPTGLVLCRVTDETAVNAGQIYTQEFVNQILELKGTPLSVGRGGDFWLRFMDTTGVQGSFEADFSQRKTVSTQSWTSTINLINAYQAGTITNTGASGNFTDLYSCASNPSASPASGPPIDCEIIQGTPSSTNGALPGLTVAGRSGFGNWPIINSGHEPIILKASGAPASAGLTLNFTFSASWLNGNVAYTGFTYTTITADTLDVRTFYANLSTALTADLILRAGKIVFANNGITVVPFIMPPTPLSGSLTVSITGTGAGIMTVCSILPSSIGTGTVRTFVFNAILGAFIYNSTTFVQSTPYETMVELCNRTGSNLWFTFPVYTKGAFITSTTDFFTSASTGITSGLKFGVEVGNEMWNPGGQPWGRALAYGIALGLFTFPYGGNFGNYSWSSLRTIQYAALCTASWTALRSANDLYIFSQTQVDDTTVGGNFDNVWLKSQFLTTSGNANYANYGGIGASAGTAYTAAPNRCVDKTTAIGMAPYWGSSWMGGSASDGPNNMNGTVAQNAAMLQASFDYASGSTATAFASLVSQFNNTTTKSGGSTGAYNLGFSYLNRFVLQEALAASYDSQRLGIGLRKLAIIHYEGGPQWALGAFTNGVNTANSLAASISSSDITTLAARMTTLGWTTGQLAAYTVSGLGTLAEVALNLLQMEQGWKYDTDLNGTDVNTNSYKNFIKTYYYAALASTSGANRETKGCQYGYTASQWGIVYSTYNANNPKYENYYAISEYNA